MRSPSEGQRRLRVTRPLLDSVPNRVGVSGRGGLYLIDEIVRPQLSNKLCSGTDLNRPRPVGQSDVETQHTRDTPPSRLIPATSPDLTRSLPFKNTIACQRSRAASRQLASPHPT